jgi:hypothetical protein
MPRAGKGRVAGVAVSQPEAPLRARFDVLRPTGFSARSVDWKP